MFSAPRRARQEAALPQPFTVKIFPEVTCRLRGNLVMNQHAVLLA